MKTRHKEALNDLGITIRKYVVTYEGKVIWDDEGNTDGCPHIWGTALIRERQNSTLYIEHQADEYGGNWKWYLRTKQGDHSSSLSTFKRQQDAIGGAIGYWYTY